jgi:hypothetical protein
MSNQEFTREDRHANKCDHHTYYAQFVTTRMIEIVKQHIGMDAIRNSKDEHMNDIPLQKWERIKLNIKAALEAEHTDKWRRLVLSQLISAMGSKTKWVDVNKGIYFTTADGVCLAKTAARIMLELESKSTES